jgi:SAM-dependent methyltransferase
MRVASPERRLQGFWGRVDARHNALVRARIASGPVLDLGCGFGTLTRAVTRDDGMTCVGADNDPSALATARRLCRDCRFELCDASALPFDDASFGTIVMRDSLHHLVNASNWPGIAGELLRVLQPRGRVVVLDPNVTAIVRLARLVVRHEDEACSGEQARATMEALGLRVSELTFNTLFSLPLSGGYVGVPLVPRIAGLQRLLLWIEERLERVLARTRVLRRLAWRYLLVADRV